MYFGICGHFMKSKPCMLHALWAEVGGGITFVTSGKKYSTAHKTAYHYFGMYVRFMIWEPYTLASGRQPSLHGYDACMVFLD